MQHLPVAHDTHSVHFECHSTVSEEPPSSQSLLKPSHFTKSKPLSPKRRTKANHNSVSSCTDVSEKAQLMPPTAFQLVAEATGPDAGQPTNSCSPEVDNVSPRHSMRTTTSSENLSPADEHERTLARYFYQLRFDH